MYIFFKGAKHFEKILVFARWEKSAMDDFTGGGGGRGVETADKPLNNPIVHAFLYINAPPTPRAPPTPPCGHNAFGHAIHGVWQNSLPLLHLIQNQGFQISLTNIWPQRIKKEVKDRSSFSSIASIGT